MLIDTDISLLVRVCCCCCAPTLLLCATAVCSTAAPVIDIMHAPPFPAARGDHGCFDAVYGACEVSVPVRVLLVPVAAAGGVSVRVHADTRVRNDAASSSIHNHHCVVLYCMYPSICILARAHAPRATVSLSPPPPPMWCACRIVFTAPPSPARPARPSSELPTAAPMGITVPRSCLFSTARADGMWWHVFRVTALVLARCRSVCCHLRGPHVAQRRHLLARPYAPGPTSASHTHSHHSPAGWRSAAGCEARGCTLRMRCGAVTVGGCGRGFLGGAAMHRILLRGVVGWRRTIYGPAPIATV